MKFKQLLSLAALSLMAAATLTSCEDILGEWSRPTPAAVTPSAIAVTGITLDADATINVGETKTLTATVAPDNATDKTVSWISEDETIATVADGVVTAVAAGTTIITATANDGSGVKATCTVTVKIPGLLAGKFTINGSGKQVQFSQGNLQATTNDLGVTWTWAFAEHQWDYIGGTTDASDPNATTNNKINDDGTVSDNGTVDLFGWVGASSNWGDIRMYGITSSGATNAKEGYGDGPTESLKSDWGTLAISNGGNTANSGWRTLKSDEWTYLFNGRTSVTTRYCKATVNGVSGVVLFPDSYTHPDGVIPPTSTNTANAAFTTNSWTSDDWSKMEAAGCVFLPAAGERGGSYVSSVGSYGRYWSSSPESNVIYASHVNFFSDDLEAPTYHERSYGHSVRLVRDVAE